MLKIEQLNQFYGQSHTLWDLDLEVPDGQCTVLMGRNGVGKTTLLKCIMGLLPVRSGSLQYDGQELTRTAAEQRAGIGIGYVPQGRQIFPLMSVEENLLIGLPARRDGQRRHRRAEGIPGGDRWSYRGCGDWPGRSEERFQQLRRRNPRQRSGYGNRKFAAGWNTGSGQWHQYGCAVHCCRGRAGNRTIP